MFTAREQIISKIKQDFDFFETVDEQGKFTLQELKLPACLISSGNFATQENTNDLLILNFTFQGLIIAKEADKEAFETNLISLIKFLNSQRISGIKGRVESGERVEFSPELPTTVAYQINWNNPVVIK